MCQEVIKVEGRAKVSAHKANNDSSTQWQGSEILDRPIYGSSGRKELGGVRVAHGKCGYRLDVVPWHQRIVFLGDCYATTESKAIDLFYNPIRYTVHC